MLLVEFPQTGRGSRMMNKEPKTQRWRWWKQWTSSMQATWHRIEAIKRKGIVFLSSTVVGGFSHEMSLGLFLLGLGRFSCVPSWRCSRSLNPRPIHSESTPKDMHMYFWFGNIGQDFLGIGLVKFFGLGSTLLLYSKSMVMVYADSAPFAVLFQVRKRVARGVFWWWRKACTSGGRGRTMHHEP